MVWGSARADDLLEIDCISSFLHRRGGGVKLPNYCNA